MEKGKGQNIFGLFELVAMMEGYTEEIWFIRTPQTTWGQVADSSFPSEKESHS